MCAEARPKAFVASSRDHCRGPSPAVRVAVSDAAASWRPAVAPVASCAPDTVAAVRVSPPPFHQRTSVASGDAMGVLERKSTTPPAALP